MVSRTLYNPRVIYKGLTCLFIYLLPKPHRPPSLVPFFYLNTVPLQKFLQGFSGTEEKRRILPNVWWWVTRSACHYSARRGISDCPPPVPEWRDTPEVPGSGEDGHRDGRRSRSHRGGKSIVYPFLPCSERVPYPLDSLTLHKYPVQTFSECRITDLESVYRRRSTFPWTLYTTKPRPSSPLSKPLVDQSETVLTTKIGSLNYQNLKR